MSSLSGSSPDPLHLASSPISAHTFTRRRSVAPAIHSSGTPVPRHSPSKSFLMDAGDSRIKVTVQSVHGSASQSPSKRPSSRTTTIPLRTGESSPVARRKRLPTPAAHLDESDIFRRSLRKRTGPPIESPRHSARNHRFHLDSAVEEEEYMPQFSQPARDSRAPSAAMFSEQSVPSSEIRRRRSLYPMRNQRNKRLSTAREELDDALQNALSEREGWSDALHSERGGELTSANEDFTMITGESLASIKASTTMLSGHDEGENSHVSVEHLTSSPPKVAYPDLTEQANHAKTPLDGEDQDAMRWKSTGPTVSQLDLRRSEDREDHNDLEDGSQGKYEEDSAEEEDVEAVGEDDYDDYDDGPDPVVEDIPPTTYDERQSSHHKSPTPQPGTRTTEQDASLGAQNPAEHGEEPADEVEDDDIWAEEASREIEESAASHRPLHSTTISVPPIFNESIISHRPKPATTVNTPPVPAEQPDQRRKRSRLPRTWRQNNGVDSSYTDSTGLSNERTTLEQSQENLARRGSGDDSGRSSGVLTPPSTDDDEARQKDASFQEPVIKQEPVADGEEEMFDDNGDQEDDDDEMADEEADEEVEQQDDGHGSEDEEGDISGFTNPNAADTQLEAHHRFGQYDESPEKQEDELASPLSDASENGEDTGFFWQTNLPSVYKRERPRPQQRKPIDLSAILRMDSSKVEDAPSKAENANSENNSQPQTQPNQPNGRHSPLRMRPVNGKVSSTPSGNATGRLLNTPLRKSLLRSSKAMDAMDSPQKHSPVQTERHKAQPVSRVEETQVTATDESFASKDSDQRQLLEDLKLGTPSPKKPAAERLAVLRDDDHARENSRSQGMEPSSFQQTEPSENWPEHSYEENLNIASPQRINVNFNDSTLSYQQHQQQQPSLLQPRNPVRPLFDRNINAPVLKPSFPATTKQTQDPSIGESFLTNDEATTTTSTHQEQGQENEGVFSRLNTTFWSAVARPQKPPPTPHPSTRTTEQTISLSLRASLRSRYGVLPNSHPWTMHHMRTLHRLLNSLESGRRDSIVPTHTPLPTHLRKILNTDRKDATGRLWRCESSHTYVVQAFLQLLVDPALYRSMQNGEVDWLGDAQAAHLRGTMGGRDGGEVCFKSIKPKRGAIAWDWVLECLGCCVRANLETGVRGFEMREGEAEVEMEKGSRDVEFSVMGDGEGDGRVRMWFERERGVVG
ncbi:hypothetical protein Q7P37_005527 [Cladosporium fusiforme]